MSRNLVVRFKGITYLVEPSPETLRFAGKRVRVFESWRTSGSALLSQSSGFAAGAGQVRRASRKLTFARRSASRPRRSQRDFPHHPARKGSASSFLERYEAEQKARWKVRNDRAALRRKAQVEAAQQRRSG